MSMWSLLISSLVVVGAEVCPVGRQCNGPAASLMQLNSLKEHVEVEEDEQNHVGGVHHKALLGFQKYATELIDKVVGHNTNLSQGEIDAIQTIILMIDDFYTEFQVGLTADKELVDVCPTHFDNCVTQMNVETNLDPRYNDVTSTRNAHNECRDEQVPPFDIKFTECDDPDTLDGDVVHAYHPYRHSDDAILPSCAITDLTPEMIATDNGEDLGKMEACLEEMNVWLYPLYDRYVVCDDADTNLTIKDTDCDTQQSEFQEDYCIYESVHTSTCLTYTQCWETAIQTCNQTCAIVATSVEARKADNVTGELVRCLLNVLLDDNEDKPTELQACMDKTFDTSFWDVACVNPNQAAINPWPPARLALPAPHPDCGDLTALCTSQFIQDEYASRDWYAKLQNSLITCDPQLSCPVESVQ